MKFSQDMLLREQMEPVHLIITGGTIDSYIDRSGDTKTSFQSSVREYLEEAVLPYFPISESVIALKDSREITDEVRADICEEIMSSPCRRFLITHGTFTLSDTAQFLQERSNKLSNKTIILTGSFYPLRHFAWSDASFNLGYAIGLLQLLPPGIYIAMHGRIFTPGSVKKDLQRSRFEPI